jgi:lantibiotic modifying enzyme
MHNYAEGISFYYITKEEMDKLLDRVKKINKHDYDKEAKDGFQSAYRFWNEQGREALEEKIHQLDNQIRVQNL